MADAPAKKNSYEVVSRLTSKAARYRAKLEAAEAEKKALADRVAELEKAPKADQVVKERDEARGQLRARDHRAAFDKVADELKVRKDARGDLWELSKLDTSSDTPDPAAIKSALEGKVKERSYLIEAEANATAQPLNRGQGADRGAAAKAAGLTVTTAQATDPVWMAANQAAIAAAHADGTLRVVS